METGEVEFKDIEKQCKEEECKKPFILTAGEQRYFSKKMDEESGKPLKMPTRCPDCRAKKRRAANSPFNVLRGKEVADAGVGKEASHMGVGKEGQE